MTVLSFPVRDAEAKAIMVRAMQDHLRGDFWRQFGEDFFRQDVERIVDALKSAGFEIVKRPAQ